MTTEGQWAQGNSGHRGTLSTEEQWVQRNSGHRETVGTQEQWAHRNSDYRGTVGKQEHWAQRNSEHRGTVGASGILPGKGSNTNEALHKWMDNLLGGGKMGARLEYDPVRSIA